MVYVTLSSIINLAKLQELGAIENIATISWALLQSFCEILVTICFCEISVVQQFSLYLHRIVNVSFPQSALALSLQVTSLQSKPLLLNLQKPLGWEANVSNPKTIKYRRQITNLLWQLLMCFVMHCLLHYVMMWSPLKYYLPKYRNLCQKHNLLKYYRFFSSINISSD